MNPFGATGAHGGMSGSGIQNAALNEAADGAGRPDTAIRHSGRGPGYGVPIAGLVILAIGLFLLGDTLRHPSVSLGQVPNAKVGRPGEPLRIDVSKPGPYFLVVTDTAPSGSRTAGTTRGGSKVAALAGEPGAVGGAASVEASTNVSTGIDEARAASGAIDRPRLEYAPEGAAVAIDDFTVLQSPTTVVVSVTQPGIGGVYLVPVDDPPMSPLARRLVVDAALIVVGGAVFVVGAIRRRAWTKQVRAYAAQIEATQHGPVG